MSEVIASVTLKRGVDKDTFLEDFAAGTAGDLMPARVVEITNEKAISSRVFEALLTEAELVEILKDNRIYGALALSKVPEIELTSAQPLEYIERAASGMGTSWGNWGLLSTLSEGNPFSDSNILTNTLAKYGLTGEGVDLIIAGGYDSQVYSQHPEWLSTKTGLSRFVEFDWSTLPGWEWQAFPNDFYTSTTVNHETAGLSVAAGKLYGLAKEARVYSIAHKFGWTGTKENWPDAQDIIYLVKQFHLAKSEPRRPTVWVNPYVGRYRWTDFEGITEGVFRGASFSGNANNMGNAELLLPYLCNSYWSWKNYSNSGGFCWDWASNKAAVEECLDAGVIMVGSAGNDGQWLDDVGGVDYDNRVRFVNPNFWANYNQGSNRHEEYICAGAYGISKVAGKDQVSPFSNRGPRVDVFAPGRYLVAGTYGTGSTREAPYPGYPSFKIGDAGGTSFAAPMVAGAVACLLQLRPWLSPGETRSWLRSLARTGDLDTSTATYATDEYYLGENDRRLHLPFNKKKSGVR